MALDDNSRLRNDSGMVDITQASTSSGDSTSVTDVIRKEFALFAILLFLGFVIMPMAIFWVGKSIFGPYGGAGYGDFFGTISEKIRSGDGVAWLLVLAPYLIWQCLRLMALAWRRLGRVA